MVVFCGAFSPYQSSGSKHSLHSRFLMGEEYNSNVFWTSRNPQKDRVFSFSPSFTWEKRFPRDAVSAQAGLNFIRYRRNDELDSRSEHYWIAYDTDLTPRFQGNLTGTYFKDTTLESDLEETGIVYSHAAREKYTVSPRLTWLLSEKSRASLSYNYSGIFYTSSSYIEYDVNEGALLISHRMHDGRVNFRWKNGYTRYDYYSRDRHFTDNYHSLLGADYRFSELITISADGGIRFSKTGTAEGDDLQQNDHTTERSRFGQVSFQYQHSRGTITSGLSKDITPSGTYGVITQDKLYLTADYQFLRTLSCKVNLTRNSSKTDNYVFNLSQKHTINYYEWAVSLMYRFRKHAFIELMYRPQFSSRTIQASDIEIEEERKRTSIFFRLGVDHGIKL